MDSVRQAMHHVCIPDATTRVFKEECCISFDTPRSEGGLFVDLSSFLAFGRDCVEWNYAKTGHPLYLRLHSSPESEERPSKKPTLLAIGVEGGFEPKEKRYKDEYSVVVLPSFEEFPYPSNDLPDQVAMAVEKVLSSEGAEKQQQLSAWVSEKMKDSPYPLSLQQLDNGVVVAPSGWKCAKCDQVENLWLNLTDGSILCGRRNWDGSGGNNHAVEYYEATKYPLAVKLGTITADLSATDVYSYPEDDAVEDPLLAQHLAHFGIDFSSLQKTEMTTAERELDQNMKFEWNRIQEKGKDLEPLFGPGYTGLANLGNSCYLGSVMQVVFSTTHFNNRYYEGLKLEDAFRSSPSDPTMDFNTQMAKLANGLLSGKYSVPAETVANEDGKDGVSVGQDGIPPRMFKNLIGKGHPEFSTSRQQDALEFYQYLLEQVERSHPKDSGPVKDPSLCFRFRVEERIQCGASGRVKYIQRTDNMLSLPIPLDAAVNKEEMVSLEEKNKKVGEVGDAEAVRPRVPLQACLNAFSSPEEISGFYSSAIKGRTSALKTVRLSTFPDYLVLHMRKFVLVDGWVPKKLDVFLDVPDELDLTSFRSSGQQPTEELLEEEDSGGEGQTATRNAPIPEESIVTQLMDMGFPRNRCELAALRTSNVGSDEAMNWLLAHMEDADIDDPQPTPDQPTPDQPTPDQPINEEHVSTLLDFGFTETAARNALRAMKGNVECAAEWIFNNPEEAEAVSMDAVNQTPPSTTTENVPDGCGKYELKAFVSHIGANTQCGHYVCHIKKDGRWVLFNDSKVAASGDLPKDMGYLYFYQRRDS